MPASAYSSSTSHGSQNSRKTRQYVKIANSSQVDESLFGNNNHYKSDERVSSVTNLEQMAHERSKRRSAPVQRHNTLQLLTKDLVRNLIIPDQDPSGQSIVISRRDLRRLRHGAEVMTEEERQEVEENLKKQKEDLLTDVQERKAHTKEQDLKRRKNEKLNDLEEEERAKHEMLRERAMALLAEQEDEVKKLNEALRREPDENTLKTKQIQNLPTKTPDECWKCVTPLEMRMLFSPKFILLLILDAKCHIIRDTQILEKRIINKELEEDERRLDELMEVERVNALQIQEEIEKKRKEEQLIGAMRVMEQIEENEKNKLLELELKDQENRQMKKYLDQLCEEEAEKILKHRREQAVLRDELNEYNADIIRRKELAKEEERLLEAKVIQFQKDKAEREAEFEAEQRRIKVEKEKEVARLRALQERARDEQAERDALRAKRAQEQTEREYRKKEAEEARKKADMEAMLMDAREQQRRQKEHSLAVQAQRERADFERVLRAQQEQMLRQKQDEAEVRKKRCTFSDEIRKQIKDKEQERLQERAKFFEEGEKLNEEARQRKLKLEEIKRKKLDELRAAGIHEKYLSQIERKVNRSQRIAA